jgi:hypothetical protein
MHRAVMAIVLVICCVLLATTMAVVAFTYTEKFVKKHAFALGAGVCLAIVLLLVVTAGAHDHSRPELDGWFKSLRSKANTPCCDGSDQTGLQDPEWERVGDKFRVLYKGKWYDVPPDAVVEGPNKVGHAMVWPVEYGDVTVIRCFMPGAMT